MAATANTTNAPSEATPISISSANYDAISGNGAETSIAGKTARRDTRPLTGYAGMDGNGNGEGEGEGKITRWSAFWEKWGSVELENKGSVARDHLALERTFLAWLRTSLSFASIGIAITQLFRLNSSLSSHSSTSSSTSTTAHEAHLARLRHLGKPLGATFIGISILMLVLGFHRYFEAQHYVIRGKFPASRGSIVVVSVVAGGLIVGSLGVVLGAGPGVEA